MFKFLLIWRYFIKKRVAWIAVVAVTLLVMLVVVVLSVMSGLLKETREKNHRWCGDIVISRDSLVGFPYYQEFIDQLAESPSVYAATPIIKTFGLSDEQGSGQIFGVRLDEFCRATGFAQTLHYGGDRQELSFVVPELAESARWEEELTDEQKQRGCIISIDTSDRPLFEKLWRDGHLKMLWPISITVFGISSRGTLTGPEMGMNQRFWYVDDSSVGLVDIDRSTTYVDFDQLQKLCWMDGQDGKAPRASEIRIKLKKGVALDKGHEEVARQWRKFGELRKQKGQGKLLGDVTVQSWKEYRRSNIAPMENERTLMIIIFSMIAVVAVFIIFAIFYMIVTEKIKDLGIVRSVGGSAGDVGSIFLGFGGLVGTVGAILGTALGCLIVLNSNKIEDKLYDLFGFRLWPPDLYAIEKIPDMVYWQEAAVIAAVAVVASIAGAAIPAGRAAKLEIVEALRVE